MIEAITYFSIILLLASIFGIVFIYKKITFEHFYFLAVKSYINKTTSKTYFCSKAIFYTIKILLKNRKNRMTLLYFIFARDEKAIELISRNGDIQNAIIAFKNPNKSISFFEEKVKENPQNYFALSILMELYSEKNDHIRATACFNNINPKKINKYELAKYLYFGAILDMKDGDMLSVSEKLNRASKLFNKEKAFIEEAKCYNLLSITYKACGMFDTAQFILDPVMEIYKKFSYTKGIADTYAQLGSLMSTQKRFVEAIDYFEKAKNLLKENEHGYILAQEALTRLFQSEIQLGNEVIAKAIRVCEESGDEISLSFCHEIAANLYMEEKNYKKSLKHSKIASQKYEPQNNISALLESKYIEALSLFYTDKLDEASTIARGILDVASTRQTSFHPANCYNLLGLIFLRKKEFSRARALFRESLGLEQKNNRTKEIASDYFNIGLTEIYSGKKKQAIESLSTALKYAIDAKEDDIIEIISFKIEELKKTIE